MKKFTTFAAACVLLSGCGGGGTTAVPNSGTGSAPGPAVYARTGITFTLKMPAHMAPAATIRQPRYVSASTKSLVVTLTAQNGTTVSSPQPYALNVSSCPTVNSTPTCSLAIPAVVGTDTFTVATYDAPQNSTTPTTLTGNRLSTASASTSVVLGTANTLALTLSGVVHSVSLALGNTSPSTGATATISLTVTARDADNNVIVGPGNYSAPIALANSDTSGATTLSTTSVTGPSTAVRIAYTGAPAAATFSATAPNVPTATSPSLVSRISRIYVADTGSNQIFAYSPSGASTGPTITAGINAPLGIALDNSGNIYVANTGNGTVTKYSAAGTLLMTITGFGDPVGVAVDQAGKIYVADDATNTITTFTPTGSPTTPTITSLVTPESVAVDSAANIYVADYGAGTVPVFQANGTYSRTISAGVGQPIAVAVDSAGKTYVSNAANNTLTTYTASGVPTTPTISLGNAQIVAVDLRGNIYFTNGFLLSVYTADGTQGITVPRQAGGDFEGVAVY